jgi:hypothetical protein
MANMTYAEGQKVDVYVSEVQKQGRLSVSLTPVYRRPEIGPDGRPLPVYQLSQLRVGEVDSSHSLADHPGAVTHRASHRTVQGWG